MCEKLLNLKPYKAKYILLYLTHYNFLYNLFLLRTSVLGLDI